MRSWVVGAISALLLTSCAHDTSGDGPVTDIPDSKPLVKPLVEDPPPAIRVSAPRPVWQGFSATHEVDGLAAYALGELDVYETPTETTPKMTLESTTILGTPTVLGVIGGPTDGWVEVMLPTRPNGSTGWVDVEDVNLFIADGELVIDLSDRTVTFLVDGMVVFESPVGIGSPLNPTPTGHFFVTDSVTLTDGASPWGPHALGLSARSDTITSFNGGDGIIGIHGTNNPTSIGDDVSLGCVRLPNEMITALHELVPLGTRVTIEA